VNRQDATIRGWSATSHCPLRDDSATRLLHVCIDPTFFSHGAARGPSVLSGAASSFATRSPAGTLSSANAVTLVEDPATLPTGRADHHARAGRPEGFPCCAFLEVHGPPPPLGTEAVRVDRCCSPSAADALCALAPCLEGSWIPGRVPAPQAILLYLCTAVTIQIPAPAPRRSPTHPYPSVHDRSGFGKIQAADGKHVAIRN
jgi:hypothetical protein